MKFIPGEPFREIEEHDRLLRHYLSQHENEWRSLRGLRRVLARVRLEIRAWKYARQAFDKDRTHKLY